MATAIRVEDILELDIDERLRLMEVLWESLAASPDRVAVTDAQRRVLDVRLAEHAHDPDDVVAWDDARASIRVR